MYVVAVVVFCVAFAVIGTWVGRQCGRNEDEGFLLGLLLGPIGVILVALLPRGTQAPRKRRVHHDWRFWAVIAMLVGMASYVMTMDEAVAPGVKPGQEVPAAP